MSFRHLDYEPGTPVAKLGPAALDALLERGDLESWQPLLRTIAADPWGEIAETVVRLCDANPMYGTSTLWRTWIHSRRHAPEPGGRTLAEARLAAGLTQTRVAERMGVAQSDVSKLERREDIRLSTLRAYARALGAKLVVALRLPDEEHDLPVVLGVDH